MQTIQVEEIGSSADFEHGEGYLGIGWTDSDGIVRSLTIDLDGFCSREMPVRSGTGPPDFECLERNRLCLVFQPELARRLDLEREVEFVFDVSGEVFLNIKNFVSFMEGDWGVDSD